MAIGAFSAIGATPRTVRKTRSRMSKERKEYRKKLENVPEELKALPNWVCYRLEERYGQPKPTKVPYNPSTGDKAKANDPSTWTDYETCVSAVERGEFDGIDRKSTRLNSSHLGTSYAVFCL